MSRKEDIQPPGASQALKGLAERLAAVVNAKAVDLIAKAADCKDTDRLMRSLALIARAALSVQALQAAEDKAADRALDRAADRAAAAVRAKPIHDEEDETDMNDRDPRLDYPEGVAEIYQEARRGVDGVFHRLETKRADRKAPDGGPGVGPVEKLDGQGSP